MKKKKKKLSLCLSVLIIGFLVGSSLNNNSLIALLEEKNNLYSLDSFDGSTWNWTTTEVISDDNSDFSYVPSLAVDSARNVHIAWESVDIGGTLADHKISYKYWDTSTLSWTTTEIISTESSTGSFNPCITADSNNNLHVVWEDETNYDGSGDDRDIFYKQWNAISSTWTTTEVVSTESTAHSHLPSLAVDSVGNAHVVWEDGNGEGAFYKRRNTTSSSWTTTEVVSPAANGESPAIDVDIKGNVHFAWQQRMPIDIDVYYRRWNASSGSWTSSELISTGFDFDSHRPSLDSDAQCNVHIVWDDDPYGSATTRNIYYRQWNENLGTWLAIEGVSSESTTSCYYPTHCVDSFGNIHVAWHDQSDYAESGSDWDIHYKRWDTYLSSWTTTEVISTESSGNSYYPSLVADSAGIVHIAWQDVTNYAGAGTDEDVFYKSFIGPPTAPELAFIVPNPTEFSTILLDWNNVLEATTYYVYRSTSYIWSVEGLIPISTVSSSDYIDTVPSEGFYYYVIVAGNNAGKSSHSNCQYVEVVYPDLEAPELSPILPNPTESETVTLMWNSISGATWYYVYRSISYIWSVEGLTPIAIVGSNSFIDSLPDEGYYFYVIIATDNSINSTHSNCEYILYEIPHLREFGIISSVVLSLFVISIVILRKRKINSKRTS